jgi:hypothetical protein
MEDPKFANVTLSEVSIDRSDVVEPRSFQLLVTIFDEMKAERRLSIDADSARLVEIF